jgi:hypothetical protein
VDRPVTLQGIEVKPYGVVGQLEAVGEVVDGPGSLP